MLSLRSKVYSGESFTSKQIYFSDSVQRRYMIMQKRFSKLFCFRASMKNVCPRSCLLRQQGWPFDIFFRKKRNKKGDLNKLLKLSVCLVVDFADTVSA